MDRISGNNKLLTGAITGLALASPFLFHLLKRRIGSKAVPAISENFYKSVNAWWLDDPKITIPAEYPRWGGFVKLHDESLKLQTAMLHEISDLSSHSEDERRLALAWNASMKRFQDWEKGVGDYTSIAAELATLKSTLGGQEDFLEGVAMYMARCKKIGVDSPIAWGKEANLNDSNNIVLDLSPSGLSLPSRDYYTEDKFEKERGMFKDHLNKVRELCKLGKASSKSEFLSLPDDFADLVMRFETKLAMISMKSDQSRSYDKYFTVTTLDDVVEKINSLNSFEDKEKNYEANKVDKEDPDYAILSSPKKTCDQQEIALAKRVLGTMINELGLREILAANMKKNYGSDAKAPAETVMVFDGDYFRRIFSLLNSPANRKDIVAYFQYQIISAANSYADKQLDECFFDFYSRNLRGQKAQKSSEKRSVAVINSWLGELLGKIYVTRFFSEKDKAKVKEMISTVLDVMKQSLQTNDWLTEETKKKGLKKLDKFVVKIGYPDKWKDYSSLKFEDTDSLFEMRCKVRAFNFQGEFLDKINSVKDKTKWEMTPQTVNAYFHPLNNEIVFPAAILQPPFYIKSQSSIDFPFQESALSEGIVDAVNFGGIGAVIAHEITHGYDDQGRKFDADGNINDWWQPKDAELFSSKTELMKEQAEQWVFEATEKASNSSDKEHKMNAQLCMGENLADLGGLSLAMQALQRQMKAKGWDKDPAAVKSLYAVFFRSWANIWKMKMTDAYAINALATDPHAPTSFRGNLASNIEAFYTAFPQVKPGTPMYIAPEKRVSMW